jgi:photosystem I reaction center subunit V
MSGSTAIMLAVGRFAFLPMQRRDLERSAAVSGPKTTGRNTTQLEAACSLGLNGLGMLRTALEQGQWTFIRGIGAGQLCLAQPAAGVGGSTWECPSCTFADHLRMLQPDRLLVALAKQAPGRSMRA